MSVCFPGLQIVLLVVVLLIVDSYGAQTPGAQWKLRPGASCTDPDRKQGTCVEVQRCPAILKLQLQRHIPAHHKKFLSASQCGVQGRNPLVCCATPNTKAMKEANPLDVRGHPNLHLINVDTCNGGDAGRITHGNKTGVFEFPWMALLYYTSGRGKGTFFCGGSIVNENYILTAAHCINSRMRSIGVRVGEHDTSTDRDCEGPPGAQVCAEPPQDIAVLEAIRHQQYYSLQSKYDIALLRLAMPIRMNHDSVRPVCLPVGPCEQNRVYKTGEKLTAAGWGRTESGADSPDLLKVFVPYIPTRNCADIYKKHQKNIDQRQLCAGDGVGGKDSCTGDSGGPLVGLSCPESGRMTHYVQHGIVSYGPKDCGAANFPAVYTRLGWYMPWILDNIKP